MRNITPVHLRCEWGECPSVHELEDGRLLIVGRDAFDEAERGEVAWGIDETPIIVDRAILANVLLPVGDNAGLVERLRTQAQVIRGDIEVAVNESGETDNYEHSSDGLLDTVEQAADAIAALEVSAARKRERYNLAAARVSELEAQVRELREALEPFAKHACAYDPDESDGHLPMWGAHEIPIGDLRRARAALSAPCGQEGEGK